MIVCHNQWRFKNISTQGFSPKKMQKESSKKFLQRVLQSKRFRNQPTHQSHPSYIKVEELRKFTLEAEEGTIVHCFFWKKSRKDPKNNLEVIDGEV